MEVSRQQEPAAKGKKCYGKGKALPSLRGWEKEKEEPSEDQCYGALDLMAQEQANNVYPLFTSRNHSETTCTCNA